MTRQRIKHQMQMVWSSIAYDLTISAQQRDAIELWAKNKGYGNITYFVVNEYLSTPIGGMDR